MTSSKRKTSLLAVRCNFGRISSSICNILVFSAAVISKLDDFIEIETAVFIRLLPIKSKLTKTKSLNSPEIYLRGILERFALKMASVFLEIRWSFG